MVYALTLFQILGFISSVHAILNTRTSQGAIAWVVSLNTVAVVAVPAYWVFGRSKFHGYVNAWRDASLSIDDELQSIRQSFDQFIVENPALLPELRAVKELADTGFVSGNAAELLIDGQATYDSIYAGIEQAESYVLFQFYIIRADHTGNRFKELLIRKAEEGIRVFVLYDELGSIKLPTAWINEIHNSSIEMIPFNTRQGPLNRFQLNFRNHRKIVVVDGKAAWLGGLNIGDDYSLENGSYLRRERCIHAACRELVFPDGMLRRFEVLHFFIFATFGRDQFHDRPDVLAWGDDSDIHPRFENVGKMVVIGQLRWVVDRDRFARF